MKLLAIDPGESNGWALFNGKELELSGTVVADELFKMLEIIPVSYVVYESYRLYSTHAKQMINNNFFTVQVIGVIKYICGKRGIKYSEQPALIKKSINDNYLRENGLYMPSDHRRDAIRHGIYFLNKFGDKEGNIKV